MLEKDIQTKILNYLATQRDFFFWRNNSHAVYDQKNKVFRKKGAYDINGVSDILGIHRESGKLVAIEVKSFKGVLSQEQAAFINKINQMGGFAIMARSLVGVKTLLNFIRGEKDGLANGTDESTK